jgi:hypothetical protein
MAGLFLAFAGESVSLAFNKGERHLAQNNFLKDLIYS